MKINKLIAMLIFALMATIFFSACTSEKTSEKPSIKGTYTQLPGEQFKFDGKTVEVVEFLSFYCHACYVFESAIPVIKGNLPKKISWKVVPLYWGKQGSPKPGEAYLLAVDAGKGEQMKKALFNAQMVQNINIGDVNVLVSIGREIGMDPDFGRRLRTGEKAKAAREAQNLAKAYRVDETPSLVIAGNLMTNPHVFDHDINKFSSNVLKILRSIVK